MKYIFDRETALISLGGGQYTIEASNVYRNPTGMAFGGWVAAIAAKAVELHEDCRSKLVSQTTTYLSGIGPGKVAVSAKLLRSGSSTQFWRVELLQNDRLAIAADIVTSNRRETDLNYQAKMPDAVPVERAMDMHGENPVAPQWVSTFKQKLAKGVPFTVNDTPEALVWIKEADDRPLDRASLFSICDTPMPRTFFLSEVPRMGSTVSMSTYIYATDEDIAEAGSGYLLLRVDGASARNCTTDSRVELWSANGTLLATSNQIGFFR